MIYLLKIIFIVESGGILHILQIKKYRHLRGMTQNQLAEKVGVTQQYIGLLETANIIRKRSPTLAVLEKICIALSICIKDLLYCDCDNCYVENCPKKNMFNYKEVAEENFEFYI